MGVTYTDPDRVTEVMTTDVPASGRTVSGYGGAIPTRHKIKYMGVWRRVYAMVYGNSGTPYVKVGGESIVLDGATQGRIKGV